MKDFFVSYNRADRAWAEWIAWQLEEAGLSTVIQAWDFQPGSNFVLEMHEAARQAARTIAVLSDAYLNATFTQSEWAAAFLKDPTGEKRSLLPVRVADCEVEGLLGPIVYIDLVATDEAVATQRLIEGAAGGRAKPATRPNFPVRSPVGRSRPRFPGGGVLGFPRIWNVPHRRNANFTGRQDLLINLYKAFTSGDHALLTQVIWGLGGIGKTQLAVEYAYQRADDYAVVWWVRAEELATLATDFTALASELGLASLGLTEAGTHDQPSVVTAVRGWLERNRDWLLVFDNADSVDEIRDYLPRPGSGHVLITSRNRVWQGAARTFNVPELTPNTAVEFLLKRTGQDDSESARALARELGELPLALEHAGAYVEATGCQLREYLTLIRTARQKVWNRATPPTGYSATVATTWELAFRQLRGRAPEAADLLNLCAFLAPEDIPRGLLQSGERHLPATLRETLSDQFRWDETMEAVRRYSLLDRIKDALRVHRLVQAVLYDHLDHDMKKTWADVAVRVVGDAFPPDDEEVASWPTSARLLPHAFAVAGHAQTLTVQAAITGDLLTRVGLYLRTRAHFAEAKGALERALVIAEAIYDPGHPKVATIVNDLGRVLHDLGEHSKAQASFERALKDHRAAFGVNHQLVARDLNDLGSVLLSLGDAKAAIEYLEQAKAIDEAVQSPDHPDVARDIGNLGRALQVRGDLPAGRYALQRALLINETHYGINHPIVASDLSNLGLLLRVQGDKAAARGCFERSLQIREQLLGEEHPSTVRVRDRLKSVTA